MAELTYDQFSGHGDLTEMASQINAALEKITDRIDKLDDGGSKLLDPTSQGIAVNLADGFGRNLEAYLNNPNKRMLGDWILEGTLVVDGPLTVNGVSTIVGDQTVDGTITINGTNTVNGPSTFVGNTIINGTSTMNGNMEVNGTSQLDGNVTVNGTSTLNGSATVNGTLRLPDGTSSVPSFAFTSDTAMGMYRVGNAVMGLTAQGVDVMHLSSLGTNSLVPYYTVSGSASFPSYSFAGDADTGMYRTYANAVSIATAGTSRVLIGNTGFYAYAVYNRTTGTAANVNVNSLGELRRNTSSRRYKEDIRPLTDSEADLALQLEPVRYRSATGDGASLHTFDGLISEDVVKVNPRWADYSSTPDCDCACDDDAEMWEHDETCLIPEGVQYQAIIPALLSLVKRQDARITELESKIQ